MVWRKQGRRFGGTSEKCLSRLQFYRYVRKRLKLLVTPKICGITSFVTIRSDSLRLELKMKIQMTQHQ